MKRIVIILALLCLPAFSAVAAEQVVVQMNLVNESGIGAAIGTITLSDADRGLSVKPDLTGLATGSHGVHVHEKADCGPAAKDGKPVPGLAAGGHYDPAKTGKHEGPSGMGHLGDLPAMTVDSAGRASSEVFSPHLKLSDVRGHSLMIHAGGDNYSDSPAPLGGGGARIACGVIP